MTRANSVDDHVDPVPSLTSVQAIGVPGALAFPDRLGARPGPVAAP